MQLRARACALLVAVPFWFGACTNEPKAAPLPSPSSDATGGPAADIGLERVSDDCVRLVGRVGFEGKMCAADTDFTPTIAYWEDDHAVLLLDVGGVLMEGDSFTVVAHVADYWLIRADDGESALGMQFQIGSGGEVLTCVKDDMLSQMLCEV